uniref:Uncharacterized protein n=1 Tax=Stegastes partitus TaxID=144197 RepID=A0A3B5A2R5_9TELE
MLGQLVVLCSVLTCVLCCDWLTHHKLRSDSLTLIKHMRAAAHTCLCVQVESQLVFIRDSLRLIFRLYNHDNISSASWDTDKIKEFKIDIHRQTEELRSCVSTKSTFTANTCLLTVVLCPQVGTASWEVLRAETIFHLEHVELLAASIKHAASTSRTRSATSTTRRRPAASTSRRRSAASTTRGPSAASTTRGRSAVSTTRGRSAASTTRGRSAAAQ